MLYLLIGCAAGVILTFATLWPRIARNSRRIDRLERRQRAHGFVIRHLAEGSIDPDEPEPPSAGRHGSRISRGAAGIGLVALLARRHPVGTVLAASGAAVGAAALVVTLTPLQARGGPEAGGLRASGSPVSSYTVPIVVPTVPSSRPAGVSHAAPTTALPAPRTSTPAAVPSQSTPGQPLLTVSLPPVKASVVLPPVTVPVLPTASLLPSLPVTLPSTPAVTPSPSVSGSRACVVDLRLPPVLRACVL